LSSCASKRTIPATEVVVSEFWRLDATAQAALVREKSVKPAELVDAAAARFFVGYEVWLSPTLAEPAQLEQARPWADRWPVL